MLLRRAFHRFVLGLLSLLILLTTGCATNPPPNDLNKYYRAVVHGGISAEGQERLKKYNSRLKAIAGVSDLEGDWIGCQHCTDVENGTPWPDLIYIFYVEHLRSRKMLARAWYNVHNGTISQPEINEFWIKFDSEPLDANACPASPPAPSGCTNVPSCVSTNYCDRYFPAPTPCQKCAY